MRPKNPGSKTRRVPATERFWSRVDKAEGCWIWQGPPTLKGYGSFGVDNRTWRAHRYAYTIAVGPIPSGMQVDHICRNRMCVRPDHLRLATNAENSQNQGTRGRAGNPYRGVSWHKECRKWVVRVRVAGRYGYFGLYETAEEANEAAIAARADLLPFDARAQEAADDRSTCRTCNTPGFHPPHEPSRLCEHNGTINHCTCAACW